jgi:biopolymer transport protein ExbB/TolQ
MLYFTFLMLMLMGIVFLMLVKQNNIKKIAFLKKIQSLEQKIAVLTKKLESQSLKVKLADDLKVSIKQSNKKLASKIVDANLEMFQELYSKKNL